MRIVRDAELLTTSGTFDTARVADQLESRRKKRRYAYLAWLCLGSHYLYLRRPGTQALFWLTAGGLLIWWLLDLSRIPAMVEGHNRRAVSELLNSWQRDFQQRLEQSRVAASWPRPATFPSQEAKATVADGELELPADAGRSYFRSQASERILRSGAGFALVATLMATLSIYVFAPRHVYPRASVEPSILTLRQVNARELPSTSSSVRGVIKKNVLLRGDIEEVSAKGPSTWLRVTRGTHAGRYVALQNLERR